MSYRLFNYIDWQHPSSALDEVDYDDEDDARFAKEAYQNWKKQKRG